MRKFITSRLCLIVLSAFRWKLFSSFWRMIREAGRMGENLEMGLKAFRQKRWDEAIQAWTGAAKEDSARASQALAEAHFRRTLETVAHPDEGGTEPEADLQAATKLMPEEGRYWYHLGLVRHRRADVPGAASAYERAARAGFARSEALAFVRSILTLESGGTVPSGSEPIGSSLIQPFTALAERDWERLEALPPFPPLAQTKGTPAVPGLVPLCHGLGQAGRQNWTDAARTLDAIGTGVLPGPMEAFRVAFLVDALRALGREGDARKLLSAAFSRTRSGLLGNKMAASGQTGLDEAVQGGRWAEAAQLGAALIKEAPHNLGAMAALGNALDRLARDAAAAGRWEEAVRYWKELAGHLGRSVLGAGPRMATIHHNLALALERQEKWSAAAEAWLACAASLPKRASARTRQAGALVPAKDQEELRRRRDWIERRALEMRKRAGSAPAILRQEKALLKRNPRDPHLHLEYARNLLEDGQAFQAWREAEKLLAHTPGLPGGMELLAECQMEEGYLAAAERTLRQGVGLHPGHPGLRQGLAQVLMEKAKDATLTGNWRMGVAFLEEAGGFAPQDVEIRLALGEMMLVHGDAGKAWAHLEMALARGGSHAFCRTLQLLTGRGDLAGARALVERSGGELKVGLDGLLTAAEMCLDAADAPQPRRKAGKRAKADPGPSVWEELAGVLLEAAAATGDPEMILEDITRMLLGNRPAMALPYARQRTERWPKNAEAWMDLAVILDGLGRRQETETALAKAERAARNGRDRELPETIQAARELLRVLGSGTLHRSFKEALEDPFEPDPRPRKRGGSYEEIPF